MKIILANDTYHPDVNGCAYFTHRLAKELKKRGHTVLAIVPSKTTRSGYSIRDGIETFGVRSFPILAYKGFRFSPPWFIKKMIKKVVQDFQPDVVHLQGHFFVARTVGECAHELKIPTVGTNHFMPENLIHYFPFPNSIRKKIIQWGWEKFRIVFDELDAVTTPTKTAAEAMKKSGLSKQVTPISNGIDLQKFNPKNDGEYLKNRYHIPGGVPVLFYIGRLDKEKHVDFVISCLPDVLKERKIHFVVSGKGADKEKLRKLATRLGVKKNVTFTGFVPDEDLANMYRVADCFVIAGDIELQSLVTMEAMASRLPVLAVDALALPELVRSGENGYLFKLENKGQLSQFILKIFSDSDLRKKMGEKSLEIIQTHDIEKSISRFEKIYKSLLKQQVELI